ncbi:guanylate kinase [Psychromonas sp. 14N.309.X.WAT.B.A12]|uniref:guanylate kinase n=1 Tax=unclassified Psychromonas TaxID=2614957 RepID=UPI0025B1E05C|nr:guanylate kinase [Psychromonas sp. 14N.309.X.WAT.B.A12]MDN2664535.1 guanylate kinase [Psychromonas sp. 14N.309.X.WAT.B.A12]
MSHVGTLYIVSAPSGAGKSSLIQALLSDPSNQPSQVSISHTTRSPRPGEVNGEHYHFVSEIEFKQLIEENAFFEWAEVFGNYYGTSRVAIEESLAQGIDVMLDIDWQGARQVREVMPNAKGIFILPPSREELELRLNKRGQDSQEIIAKRMQEAQSEMSHYNEYDYLIVNDDFDTAIQEFSAIVRALRSEQEKQAIKHVKTINALLEV